MTELENRWVDLGEFIREQRRIGHLSLRKLSEMAGISNPYLSQIERGLRKPSAEILQQIARALEISSETLYIRAGILDDDRTQDLVSEIRRDTSITEDQKKALISIYDSFCAENTLRAAVAGVPAGTVAGTNGSDGGDGSEGEPEAEAVAEVDGEDVVDVDDDEVDDDEVDDDPPGPSAESLAGH